MLNNDDSPAAVEVKTCTRINPITVTKSFTGSLMSSTSSISWYHNHHNNERKKITMEIELKIIKMGSESDDDNELVAKLNDMSLVE